MRLLRKLWRAIFRPASPRDVEIAALRRKLIPRCVDCTHYWDCHKHTQRAIRLVTLLARRSAGPTREIELLEEDYRLHGLNYRKKYRGT